MSEQLHKPTDTVELVRLLIVAIGWSVFMAWSIAWALGPSSIFADVSGDAQLPFTSSTASFCAVGIALFCVRFETKILTSSRSLYLFAAILGANTALEALLLSGATHALWEQVVLVLMGCVYGAGLAFYSVVWGAKFVSTGSNAGIVIAFAFGLSLALAIVLEFVPIPLSTAIASLMPLVSVLFWSLDVRIRQREIDTARARVDDTRAELLGEFVAGEVSFRAIPWRSIAVLLLINVITCFMGSFKVTTMQSPSLSVTALAIAAGPCFLYCLILLYQRKVFDIRAAFVLLAPPAVLGLLLVILSDGEINEAVSGLFVCAVFLIHAAVWGIMADVSIREGIAPFVAFGIGGLAITIPKPVGIFLGMVVRGVGLEAAFDIQLCALVCTVVLVVLLVLLLDPSDRDPEQAAEECRDVSQAPLDQVEGSVWEGEGEYDAAIARFCETIALTERETEVCTLFLKGRNIPSIAQRLYVTSGTIKSHSYRIFQKAGVSTRQQLLDYFESGEWDPAK